MICESKKLPSCSFVNPLAGHGSSAPGKPPTGGAAPEDKAGDRGDEVALSEEARQASQVRAGGQTPGLRKVEGTDEAKRSELGKTQGGKTGEGHRRDQAHQMGPRESEKKLEQIQKKRVSEVNPQRNLAANNRLNKSKDAEGASAASGLSAPQNPFASTPQARPIKPAKGVSNVALSEQRPPTRISRSQFIQNLKSTFAVEDPA